MDTRVAKHERTGISPNKFVCKAGSKPRRRRHQVFGLAWLPRRRNFVTQELGTQEMAGEQGEESVCSRLRSASGGQRTSIVSACMPGVQ